MDDRQFDTTQSARLNSEIFNTEPFGLDLPGPDLAGTRNIRPDDPTRLARTVPLDYLRNGADVVDGISVIQYDFAPSWLGDDPNRPGIVADTTYFNLISEQQKDRVREVTAAVQRVFGRQFRRSRRRSRPVKHSSRSPSAICTVATNEPTSGQGGLAVVTRDRNLDGIDDLGVMDFQDFDESIDDQFGGEFFRGAMFVVGQLLGYGYADDLPQPVSQSTNFIFTPGTDNEPAFPSVADIVHGQYLYRPDSTDIDLYRFTVNTPGDLAVETIAERLGVPSLLDTTFACIAPTATGNFDEIAQNDDYFSNDSLIRPVESRPGTYIIGVSAKGNSDYDPNIPNSGFGGRSEGEYELRIDFRPSVTNSILGYDRRCLGWRRRWPTGRVIRLLVCAQRCQQYAVRRQSWRDHGWPTRHSRQSRITKSIARLPRRGRATRFALSVTAASTVAWKHRKTTSVIKSASPTTVYRWLMVHRWSLPQGVRMIIDSGAILKISRSRIGVGSVSPLIDVSDASLQVLGTPTIRSCQRAAGA